MKKTKKTGFRLQASGFRPKKKGLGPQASGLGPKTKTKTETKTATAKTAKAKTATAKTATAKTATAKRAAATTAHVRKVRGASSRGPRPEARGPSSSRWVAFVEKHGLVLASARGPVPSVAEAVAGEPIVGSWWAHPKGKSIFAALVEIDDSPDVRCFKLIDGKITLVHRRAWPALVRLARDGALSTEQVAALQQEHMPTGEHRNIVTPFPEWVDDATAKAAEKLSAAQAKKALPAIASVAPATY